MLAKKFRLPIQHFINKKGRSLKTRCFLLKTFFSSLGSIAYSRFGVIISKKVFKKAVERNRLKRQIFDFLRNVKEKLPIADYLIIIFPPAAALSKTELNSELAKILNLNKF